MKRSLLRSGAVVLATGALVVAGPGAALAHECFVAKRSAQGAAGAANSGNWFALPRAELVAELEGILGEFGATDEQIACGMAYAEEVLPEVIAIGVGPAKGTDGVIAANMNPKNTANGTGVDHLEGVLGAVVAECGIAPPA